MMQKAEFPTGGIVRDPLRAADLVTGTIRNSRTDSKVWMREEHACFLRAQCPGNDSRGFFYLRNFLLKEDRYSGASKKEKER